MKKRKLIALVTANPESIYHTRVMEGVFDQCAKYGYDVAVFATLVQLCHYYKDYLKGELNIYNLLNYDLVDGIIVTSISFSDNNTLPIFDEMLKTLDEKCSKKVIALDLPFGKYDVVYTDDRGAFREMTRHIMDVHKCKNIYFLTGIENYAVSENRLGGFLDVLEERNIEVDWSKIFYGDFWYSSGENLADRIVSGELEKPDAVICASDHMALGLVNRLVENGIRVPEDVIVTGYDATQEGVVNKISMTSYAPKVSEAAAEAVNELHKVLEPDIPVLPVSNFPDSGLRIGQSCGCAADISYLKESINSNLYISHHNLVHDDKQKSFDISRLLDSYVYETFISAEDYKDCLREIFRATIYLRPYEDFYLCLKEDWLDVNASCQVGYPDKMRMVVHSNINCTIETGRGVSFADCDKMGERSFETKFMLPEMFENHDIPYAFNFCPIHFNAETLGYAVFVHDLKQEHKTDYVYRNWIRYVNNSLEITRIRNRLLNNSTYDISTGLLNRRGMQSKLEEIRRVGGRDILVIMADMDGLKYVNDNYGHNEGDYALCAIAESLRSAVDENEIAIRYAGDEFLFIGIGEYTDELAQQKIARIEELISKRSDNSGKPYQFSASMGYCLVPNTPKADFEELINTADGRMYAVKRKKHKNRC